MGRPRFGTDGVRGDAATVLTADFVRDLGRAAVGALGPGRWFVGRDTRESGPALQTALVEGLREGGAEVMLLGVVPTPAVAWLARRDRACGTMISASHNPYHDNGIKLFAAGGRKLSDSMQDRVQELLDGGIGVEDRDAGPEAVERPDEVEAYGAYVASTIGGRRLDDLKVVVDCANGSNSLVAPVVLRSLGATVDVIHDEPDGRNINAGCGSTHLDDLVVRVTASGADIGIAFDGDADRVLAVDAAGELVDGDQIIGICAIDRHRRGSLASDTVVVTVMTNLGFRLGMAAHGIEVVDTQVGDRYVLEALAAGGFSLGGEQSGHVIFADLATTGDGLLTSVQLLDVLSRTGRSLAELAASAMTRLPQVLVNVRVPAPLLSTAEERLADATEAAAERLGSTGRVLVRPSGTESLLRIMVEAPTEAEASAVAHALAAIATGQDSASVGL